MPKIELQHLSVTYLGRKKQEYPAIKDVSCVFEDGKISALMGESGSGKTTIFRAIAGQLLYDGTILSDGQDISKMSLKERRMAYVMQEFALYPHLTVYDNLAFPLKLEREAYKTIDEEVIKMARELSIEHLLSRRPRQLSGGQVQKVCLGRALIKKPDLILLDEPLANVDEAQRPDVLQTIKKKLEESKATAIYITHNLKEAIYVSSKVYCLENGKLAYQKDSAELGQVDLRYIFEKERQ
jgi:multiple sugar transport system ATP-binding protein